MFRCLGDYDDNELLLFWWVFSLAGFCHKSEKVSGKKANIEVENSLRDRSYCWRVLSDQVLVNNIVFAIVGNTGIDFFGWQTIGLLILAAYAYQYYLSRTVQPTDTVVSLCQFCVHDFQSVAATQCKVNIQFFQHYRRYSIFECNTVFWFSLGYLHC